MQRRSLTGHTDMIKRFDTYTVICDNCGVDHNEGGEYSGWSDSGYAEDCARESDWHCEDGKHYCDKCWSWDDDDNLVLRKIETK